MTSERRTSGAGRGIICLGLSLVCCLLFFVELEAQSKPPRPEMPLAAMAAVPVAGVMHLVALVAIWRGPKWNRRLAVAALILLWGGYGLACLGGKLGWY